MGTALVGTTEAEHPPPPLAARQQPGRVAVFQANPHELVDGVVPARAFGEDALELLVEEDGLEGPVYFPLHGREVEGEELAEAEPQELLPRGVLVSSRGSCHGMGNLQGGVEAP